MNRWSFALSHQGEIIERFMFEAPVRRILKIGRADSADIRIDEPGIPRVHATVELVDGKAILRDMFASSGTYVNGQKVDKGELHDRDEVRIGRFRLRVRHGVDAYQETAHDLAAPLAERIARLTAAGQQQLSAYVDFLLTTEAQMAAAAIAHHVQAAQAAQPQPQPQPHAPAQPAAFAQPAGEAPPPTQMVEIGGRRMTLEDATAFAVSFFEAPPPAIVAPAPEPAPAGATYATPPPLAAQTDDTVFGAPSSGAVIPEANRIEAHQRSPIISDRLTLPEVIARPTWQTPEGGDYDTRKLVARMRRERRRHRVLGSGIVAAIALAVMLPFISSTPLSTPTTPGMKVAAVSPVSPEHLTKPEPAATAPQNPAYVFHRLRSPGTLTALARSLWHQDFPAQVLLADNGAADVSTELAAGAVIQIPKNLEVIVMPGDTLGSIAGRILGDSARYGDIYELNRQTLSDPSALEVGMKLQVPLVDERVREKLERGL